MTFPKSRLKPSADASSLKACFFLTHHWQCWAGGPPCHSQQSCIFCPRSRRTWWGRWSSWTWQTRSPPWSRCWPGPCSDAGKCCAPWSSQPYWIFIKYNFKNNSSLPWGPWSGHTPKRRNNCDPRTLRVWFCNQVMVHYIITMLLTPGGHNICVYCLPVGAVPGIREAQGPGGVTQVLAQHQA